MDAPIRQCYSAHEKARRWAGREADMTDQFSQYLSALGEKIDPKGMWARRPIAGEKEQPEPEEAEKDQPQEDPPYET
jgi:hypothetical protein